MAISMFNNLLRTSSALCALSGFIIFAANAHGQTEDDEILDEIIVTGSPLSAQAGESLVGVSVIAGEALARNLGSSLGETLKNTPGVSSTFFGPGASRPLIRGQGGDRIRILDNGIGSIDASSASPDHAASVEPAMATRIEIIRGSGLLRYGSSASGGVINVIDGRIPDRVPGAKMEGAARIGVSSVDNGIEGALGATFVIAKTTKGALVGHLDTTYRKAENYEIPNFARTAALRALSPQAEARGVMDNSATKANSFAGGVSYISEALIIGAAARRLDSAYGIPGGEEDVSIDLSQTRYDALARLELGGSLFETLTINGGYGDYEHKEIEDTGEVGTIFANKGYEARAEIVQAERGAWRGAYGAQVRDRDFSAIGEEAFVPPTTTTQWGLFTFQEYDAGDWHLEAGLRYEHTAHKAITPAARIHFDGISFSGGVDYHLTETTRIGGTIFNTRRAPTTEELFSNGPHLATNQFEVGDVGLDLETGTGAEISMRFKDGPARFTANFFATKYNNYIYERETGALEDGLPVFQFSAADAVFKGFELEAGLSLGQTYGFDIDMEASLEYVDANLDISGQDALPRIPPLGVKLALSAQNDRFTLRAELDHASSQKDAAFGETLTKAYTLYNAYIGYEINDIITLRLAALNIGNNDARQHTSFLKDTVPLPGRNFKMSLAAKF